MNIMDVGKVLGRTRIWRRAQCNRGTDSVGVQSFVETNCQFDASASFRGKDNTDSMEPDQKIAGRSETGSTVSGSMAVPIEPASPPSAYCIEAQTRVLSSLSVDDALMVLTGSRLTRLQIRSELIRRRQQQLARDLREPMDDEVHSLKETLPDSSEDVVSLRGLMSRTWGRILHAIADGDLVGLSVTKNLREESISDAMHDCAGIHTV